MDQTTASYYRAILFHNREDTQLLPPSLVLLHAWTIKRCQAMGLSATITKATAMSVALAWLSGTDDGREFSRELPIGSLFTALTPDNAAGGQSRVDWDAVAPDTKVIAMIDDEPVQGEYVGRKASWLEVRIAGEKKNFRFQHVQLAGV